MSWFKVDDSLPEHPKVERHLEVDWRDHQRGIAAWVLLGAACARRGNGGEVTRELLAKVLHAWPRGEREAAAAALVAAGLWTTQPFGWAFHDWTDYQPSADEERETREAKNARQQRWRSKKRLARLQVDDHVDGLHVDTKVGADDGLPVGDGDSRALRAHAATRARGPVPSRPVPVPSLSEREAPASTSSAPGDGVARAELARSESARAFLAMVWKARTGTVPLELSALSPNGDVVAKLSGLPDRPDLEAIVARFFDDPAMRSKGWPIAWLLRNPVQWGESAAAKGGHAQPRPAGDYHATDISFADLMNTKKKPTDEE